LPENKFQAIAEVAQDSMVHGFLDFSPEDTVDIITAIAEGATPCLNTDAVYSEGKVKSVQIKSEDSKEFISLVSQGGPEAFKQELGTRKKKTLRADMQSHLQRADSIQIRKGIVCVKGSSSQPESLRFFIPEVHGISTPQYERYGPEQVISNSQ
jgi:hypothetical protein